MKDIKLEYIYDDATNNALSQIDMLIQVRIQDLREKNNFDYQQISKAITNDDKIAEYHQIKCDLIARSIPTIRLVPIR